MSSLSTGTVAESGTGPVAVGIVGLGRAGHHHLERLSIRDEFRVATIYDLDPSRSDALRHLSGHIAASWDELLRDPQVELVLLATPPETHAALACEALQAGKHVVVETPLCLTPAEADAMVRAASETGQMLSVAQTRREDEDFQLALQACQSGTLGPLRTALFIARDQAPPTQTRRLPSTGGGLLWETGYHHLDQLLLLTSCLPVRVALVGQGLSPRDEGTDDLTLHLEFPADLRATLHLSRSSRAPLHTGWILHGDAGDFANGIEYTTAPDGELIDVPITFDPHTASDYYRDIHQHLRAAGPVPCLAHDARRIVYLIEALQQSAQLQQFLEVAPQ